jgi:hypothetical protein
MCSERCAGAVQACLSEAHMYSCELSNQALAMRASFSAIALYCDAHANKNCKPHNPPRNDPVSGASDPRATAAPATNTLLHQLKPAHQQSNRNLTGPPKSCMCARSKVASQPASRQIGLHSSALATPDSTVLKCTPLAKRQKHAKPGGCPSQYCHVQTCCVRRWLVAAC